MDQGFTPCNWPVAHLSPASTNNRIAAYLDRSERTVRRWEVSEGLPVHRREHEKQDTVFAYRHEIEAWEPFTHQVSQRTPDR